MLINQFTEYLLAERNYSAHTIKAYEKDLHDFEAYLVEGISIEKAKKKDVKNYVAFLVQKGLQERTVNRKISSLQSFYKFLLLTETIAQIPTEGVKTLKYYKKIQLPFSEEEMEKVLALENVFEDSFDGVRDRLIIEMLYYTGIRKAELIGLKTKDVDVAKKEIKVIGKRNKERIVPISNMLVERVQEYINKAKLHNLHLKDSFFVRKDGKSLYPKLVYNIVNSYLSFVTAKTKRSPHMLRHSFATHLLQHGAEINAVKEILGHSSLAATQVYTHSDIEQLKKVFNHSHPRENKN